jgi:hypothetical protein
MPQTVRRLVILVYSFTDVFWYVIGAMHYAMQVFIFPGTAAQAAVACVLAVMSLVAVAKLDPLADSTDAMLYMTGCVIIFLSMFMSLLIRGEQCIRHTAVAHVVWPSTRTALYGHQHAQHCAPV